MPPANTPSSTNEYEQLAQRTETLTSSLNQMQGLQKAKEQEIAKILEEEGVDTPEAYLAKTAELEAQQATLLTNWKEQLTLLEPQVEEVSRELHL